MKKKHLLMYLKFYGDRFHFMPLLCTVYLDAASIIGSALVTIRLCLLCVTNQVMDVFLQWHQSINQSITHQSYHDMCQPINQSINQSIEQSINQSIDRTINQSEIDSSIDQSVNQSINREVCQPINQSIMNEWMNDINHGIFFDTFLVWYYSMYAKKTL